ncbi:MAG: thioredoxin family protein [Candidatus Kapaibacterium sp.]
MAETASKSVELGTKCPEFELPDTVSGKTMTREDFRSDKATVIMFICNHCPYVKLIQEKLVDVTKKYSDKGVVFAAISSNDVENYPDDAPEKMRIVAEDFGYPFPYLYDETQGVAKAFNAVCTPEFYVYDSEFKLRYHGQFDDSRPGNRIDPTGSDLKQAMDALIAGRRPDENQKPGIGCNIKWK